VNTKSGFYSDSDQTETSAVVTLSIGYIPKPLENAVSALS